MELFGAGSNQSLAMPKPPGTFSFLTALENVGVQAAASLTSIGLQSLAKSTGTTTSYTNPFTVPKSPTVSTPRSIFSSAAAGGGGIGTAVIVGGMGLLGLGLILWAALRKG